ISVLICSPAIKRRCWIPLKNTAPTPNCFRPKLCPASMKFISPNLHRLKTPQNNRVFRTRYYRGWVVTRSPLPVMRPPCVGDAGLPELRDAQLPARDPEQVF